MQVPLGVLLHNENKLDEMAKILEHYMTLVPTMSCQQQVELPNGAEIEVDNTQFHPILFGGDQLTVARIRGAQTLRDTQDNPVDRLEGVRPVVEDWHTRMVLLKVSVHTSYMVQNHYSLCAGHLETTLESGIKSR